MKTNKTTPKETVRKFKIDAEVVINTKNHKDVSDTGIMEGLRRLVEFGFEQADDSVILEAEVKNIKEATLNEN